MTSPGTGGGPTLVAGVDSSTQSCKILVCDARTGAVVRQASAPHPDGTSVHPDAWWSAFEQASSSGLLDGVAAIAVGGQQHGMVLLDDAGVAVRDALLWNDTRSASAATDLVAELGGPSAWADAVGSVPLAAFTVTKLRWTAEHEPEAAARAQSVLLPHDWLTWRIRGAGAEPVTDRGDASGTGYWSPHDSAYRMDLVERAFGRTLGLPRVLGPADAAGETVGETGAGRDDSTAGSAPLPGGILVAPGTGDNMGAALGLGAAAGDVMVSLGTSGVVSAVHDRATADASGEVAGFADATGRFLPLVCTLNAARVLGATASMLGTDLGGLDRLALSASPGAGGLVLLPYLDGERTPNLPDATGTLAGLTRTSMTPENLARAAVEGMLCGMADGLAALRAQGVRVERVMLLGGAARSAAVQRIAPDVFGSPVSVPEPAEYVALGAARQAAWVWAGGAGSDSSDLGAAEPPEWPVATSRDMPPTHASTGADVLGAFHAARRQVHGI